MRLQFTAADRNMCTQLVTTLHKSSTKKPPIWHLQYSCTFIDCMNSDLIILQHFLLYFLLFVSGAFFVHLCFLHLFACVLFSVLWMLSLQEPGCRKTFNLLLCVTLSPVIARLVCDLRLSSRCRLWWQTRGVWRCGPGLCEWLLAVLTLSRFFSPQVSHFLNSLFCLLYINMLWHVISNFTLAVTVVCWPCWWSHPRRGNCPEGKERKLWGNYQRICSFIAVKVKNVGKIFFVLHFAALI